MKQYIENFMMQDREKQYPCTAPCSVYKTLIEYGEMDDPFYGENERKSTSVCERDFVFVSDFEIDNEMLTRDKLLLVFEGIDTLSDIFLNGTYLASTDNMHRRYEFDITGIAKKKNTLRVELHSPIQYVTERAEKRSLYGVEHSMAGYQYIRKAHCMFGWDWGPKLPDMGIWRNVYVEGFCDGRINNVYFSQEHTNAHVALTCSADLDIWGDGISAVLTVIAPDGKVFTSDISHGRAVIDLAEPMLWWVRGLGKQHLYTCKVTLEKDSKIIDEFEKKIGLRTLTVSQDQDEWGEEFCFICNGVKIFAMGANYIPEDQIVTRCTKERSFRLLEDCKAANYNFIRIWGGGYYPDEWFFDWCDENGLIVWQDFMFACAAYLLSPEFEATVREEVRDNIIRIRNHACLGLWCGNNEIESAWEYWGWNDDAEAKADYLRLFEDIIPSLVKHYDPETFYWPSSPSSGGGFMQSSSNHAGDMHYWDIWHNFKPIEAFRQHYYRFCSEYGFESVPDIKTCMSFAQPKDLDLCGTVMQAHQKCTHGNEKLMFYLAQMVNYPYDFERLIYCSQLVQADCIRSSVEHMRRARGRCMGSAYWQVNDSNPVISWSSIDYFGRWKALHYYAARFYAPILLSCDDTVPERTVLFITNDTLNDEHFTVCCRLRDHGAKVLKAFSVECEAPAMSAVKALSMDLTDQLKEVEDRRTRYIEYSLIKNSEAVSYGTTLFVRPKEFSFLTADTKAVVSEKADCFELALTSDVYAKSVCLSLKDRDCRFSDNWFDIHGDEPVIVRIEKVDGLSLEAVTSQLLIRSY